MSEVELTHERELTTVVQECLPDGSLNPEAVGWSRHPLHDCNLLGRWGRKKRWEFWCVTTDTHLFMLTYANLDYLGLAAVGFLADYETAGLVEKSAIVPLALGMRMPPRVASDALQARGPGLTMHVNRSRGATGGDAATLLRASGRTVGGHTIEADLRVETPPGHETLNVVVPWSDTEFQFTSKQNCLPATGAVTLDGVEYRFGPENHAFGCQDFGRGIWPYRTTWNWASASGVAGGSTVGITIGGKWTDGTGVTENGFVVDGVLHKLGEELEWDYDTGDLEKPWRVRAPKTGRLDLAFTPFHGRTSSLQLGLLSTRLHHVFARVEGSLVCDDGTVVEVDDLVGWAEEHVARW